jgi:hypothetical protein
MAVRDPAALVVIIVFVNIGFGLIGLVEPLFLDAFVVGFPGRRSKAGNMPLNNILTELGLFLAPF